MPTERTVLSTLGDLGRDLAAPGAASGHHRDRRGRGRRPSGPLRQTTSPGSRSATGQRPLSVATYVEIDDPADPRLADYRDLRDVQLRQSLEAEHGLFLAEGEKVVRRAVEAGFPVRSFLMAPRWLDGLADVLATDRRPLLRRHRSPRRAGHRLPRPPRRTRLAGAHPAALARRGARGRQHRRGLRGRRRPHQRRRHLQVRRGARRRRCAAGTPVRRPAVPALGEGGHGRRVRAAVDTSHRLVRRPPGSRSAAGSTPSR